ncbi:MAG: tRNA (adenosine(37)-N6)-threonylcarbamoyltransferase complex ATPase subunit type 1 TsaE [Patescibacteria group bacterium]
MLSKNPKETRAIAEIFLKKILQNKKTHSKALVVGLSGDLGAGKTNFTQAVAKYLGIKNKVRSPTFVIIKKYPIKSKKYDFLFHIDAYRLKNEKELLYLGWEEIIGNNQHLVFIEWPENVAKIIPPEAKLIHISHTKTGHRNFKF